MPIIKKKWRDLPDNERLNIPHKYLEINKDDIIKIRKIKDGKKRLIKAAKLQYELYGNIHSYLTVWIAGYLSDVTVRQKFGSTRNLLELFYNTTLKNKEINQSWSDIKRKIKIPQEISVDLAEETGIHIGDGNLNISRSKNNFCSYRYVVSGNLEEEYLYHKEIVQKLLKKLYNYAGFESKRIERNSIDTTLKSRTVFEFKNKVLKLPIGPKYKIEIPSQIINNQELVKRCLIGIFDTDFTLNDSTNLVGNLTNIKVIKQMHRILTSFNIKHSLLFKDNFGKIRISKQGTIKIIENWGLSNVKHISKYHLWKEFGVYIPFSKTEERLAVLNGELELDDLKKICNKRRKMSRIKRSVSR